MKIVAFKKRGIARETTKTTNARPGDRGRVAPVGLRQQKNIRRTATGISRLPRDMRSERGNHGL